MVLSELVRLEKMMEKKCEPIYDFGIVMFRALSNSSNLALNAVYMPYPNTHNVLYTVFVPTP